MASVTPNGILLWNKPAGVTSFGALAPIKKTLGKHVKVGHAGTLDQAAQGLQLVLIGAMTRLNPIFSHLDKEYTAVIHFGYETSTLDREGILTNKAPLPMVDAVIHAIKTFSRGSIKQIPPVYSAIHVNGKRAYQYAQQGIDLEMKERIVSLYDVQIVEIKQTTQQTVDSITLSIRCGGGFYIRSFARDLAYACNSVATLTALERTGIGYHDTSHWAFHLEQAHSTPDNLLLKLLSPWEAIRSLPTLHTATIKQEAVIAVTRGNPFHSTYVTQTDELLTLKDNEPLFLFNPEGILLAQVYQQDDRWHYQFVVHHT
ncbi:tRNA pseudouridine(55) synthase TruB [Entomospira nematocerorum]|uniref:tRNA pseudouridine synthase B n=1 Tax=Entomospira nematocerorum TaxID=2719987 RepID=A0A968GFF9_9SPIO|nr:tRNA pseudouridine(55) synthase TruB [Entomospira nematocera]NIZ46796.1 tRNA pseudouridine(55) synthase TruB [Entomospira nematocera]WDI33407.1 tRNA pseudouridine(55) synthase TruB [Entomospira nematocera]